MYILIAGGGKVGANLASTLQLHGHEITLIEADRRRYERLEQRFGTTSATPTRPRCSSSRRPASSAAT